MRRRRRGRRSVGRCKHSSSPNGWRARCSSASWRGYKLERTWASTSAQCIRGLVLTLTLLIHQNQELRAQMRVTNLQTDVLK
ncbi:hypothetical protein DL93DRAFT_1964150 [Clavulina sp. PMI_390]|nr:hypothetical protein DL93DRAFT_1964150 [Clavulina sp. PMI_390]